MFPNSGGICPPTFAVYPAMNTIYDRQKLRRSTRVSSRNKMCIIVMGAECNLFYARLERVVERSGLHMFWHQLEPSGGWEAVEDMQC